MLSRAPLAPMVRQATAEDEAAIYDALVALYADNPVPDSYTPERVKQKIAEGASLAHQYAGLIGIIDGNDGEIAATIGIYPYTPWYTNEWMLTEMWLFVRPAYRRHHLHKELFAFARAYRDAMSDVAGRPVKMLTSVSSKRRLAAKFRVWNRFADMVGGFFLLR